MNMKRRVLNEHVIPMVTNGRDTWVLTTAQMEALAVVQKAVELIMLGITLDGRKHSTWIRQQTGVTYIASAKCRNIDEQNT